MSAGWTTAAADLPYRRGYGASCPGSFSPHRSRSGRCNAPFFSALHALAVDDAGRWAGLAPHRLAALHIERVMDAFERSVPCPQIEIVEQRAARRQILRHVTPLATRAQNVHQAVDNFAQIDRALAPAAFGWRDQRRDMRPFGVGDIAGIAQLVAVVFRSVLGGPHRAAPPESGHRS